MDWINIYEFKEKMIKALEQFEKINKEQFDETNRLRVQSEKDWWEEFKQRMEDV